MLARREGIPQFEPVETRGRHKQGRLTDARVVDHPRHQRHLAFDDHRGVVVAAVGVLDELCPQRELLEPVSYTHPTLQTYNQS